MYSIPSISVQGGGGATLALCETQAGGGATPQSGINFGDDTDKNRYACDQKIQYLWILNNEQCYS